MRSIYFLQQGKVTEMMREFIEGESIKQLVSDLLDDCRVNNDTLIMSQVSVQFKDYNERCAFLKKLSMNFYQEKIVFILDKFEKDKIPKYKLSYKTPDEYGYDKLTDMLAATFESTLDRKDKQDVELFGARAVAEDYIGKNVEYIDGERSWWQIGIYNGTPVGYVLPIKFKDSDRDGLIEGTIQHIGVMPEFRGNGFGIELLNRGCDVLNEIGMWRIYSDVDTENLPSLKTFRSAGHREADTITKFQMEIS